MNLTRRAAITLGVTALLTACGRQASQQSSSNVEERSGWHGIVVEGVAFDVMDGLEIDETGAKHGDTYDYYAITGDNAPYSIVFSLNDAKHDLTGTYEVYDSNGSKVYWSVREDEVDTSGGITFDYRGRECFMSFMFPDNTKKQAKDIVFHTVETLSF